MADRKPLISGNWKMHHNHFEAIQMVQKLSYILNPQDYEKVDVSVHPPFTDLRSIQTVIESVFFPYFSLDFFHFISFFLLFLRHTDFFL